MVSKKYDFIELKFKTEVDVGLLQHPREKVLDHKITKTENFYEMIYLI